MVENSLGFLVVSEWKYIFCLLRKELD